MAGNMNLQKAGMTRSKALKAMGAMAVSVPFIRSAVDNLGRPEIWSGQDKTLNDPVLAKAISELEY
jgi:hypothetical protein